MKKLSLLLTTMVAAVGTQAYAQSAFEGAYGQVSAGYEHNLLEGTSFTNSAGAYSGTFTTNAANADLAQVNLGVGYYVGLPKNFLLGVGVEYSVMNSTFNSTYAGAGCRGACFAYPEYTISNRYSLVLMPAYEIDKGKLVYLKAGYTTEELKSTTRKAVNADNNFSRTTTLDGYVLGFGYKQIIKGGLYGFGESNYYNYTGTTPTFTAPAGDSNTAVSRNSTTTNLLVGVGYKF